MMFLKQVSGLHENLPYHLLKLWGSSDRLVALSRKFAFGGNEHIKLYSLLQGYGKMVTR